MTDQKPVRTDVTPADMDPQGNVVVWDHGPIEPENVDHDSDEFKRAASDAKVWHDKNGDGPVPIVMHASDAGHAISVEPDRYALEPLDLDDGDVETEVKAIQERREEAAKFWAEQKAAAQYAADRKVAIATVMARRQAAADDDSEPKPAPVKPPPPAPAPAPAPRPQPVARETPL